MWKGKRVCWLEFCLIGQVFTKWRVPSQGYAEGASLLCFAAKSVTWNFDSSDEFFLKLITLKRRKLKHDKCYKMYEKFKNTLKSALDFRT